MKKLFAIFLLFVVSKLYTMENDKQYKACINACTTAYIEYEKQIEEFLDNKFPLAKSRDKNLDRNILQQRLQSDYERLILRSCLRKCSSDYSLRKCYDDLKK